MIKMLKTKFFILIFFGAVVASISAGPRLKNIPILGQCFGQKAYNPSKVWSKFNATDVSGKVVEYQIRNIPKARFPEALTLMQQFIEEETQNKAIAGLVTENSIQKYKQRCESVLRYNISVACFNNEDKMVGVVLLYIGKKPGSKSKRGEPEAKYLGFNVFDHYGVDEYLSVNGMNVLRKYRGRGIAKELVLELEDICEEYGLQVVAGIVSNETVNKIGNELGYDTHYVESYAHDDVMLTLRSKKFQHK